jgi:DNA-binding transcriptional ArsR family regulator
MSRSGIESALDLLSNETRFDILRALATQRFDETDATGMTFTELFEAIETDDSGNFNYHLKRLLDRLVTKEGEYYRLTHGGIQLFSSLQATTYAPGYEEVIPLDQSCPLCQGALRATYREGYLDIGCEDHLLLETYVHPTWIGSLSTDEFLRRVSVILHHQIEEIVTGFCPLCHGALGCELRTDAEPYPVQYYYPCEQCGTELRLRPQQTVSCHVSVQAFYRERGIELRETPPWQLYETYGETTVRSEDPPRVEFDLDVGGETAVLTVDGRGNVVSFDRP